MNARITEWVVDGWQFNRPLRWAPMNFGLRNGERAEKSGTLTARQNVTTLAHEQSARDYFALAFGTIVGADWLVVMLLHVFSRREK